MQDVQDSDKRLGEKIDPSPPSEPKPEEHEEELVVLNVPASVGVCPIELVEDSGQLVYPICINGYCTEGFYDIGATISVMRRDCAKRLNLPLSILACPIRVIEFSRPGPLLKYVAEPEMVELAGHRDRWRFVIADSAPRPIVIGLDMDRAWQLARIPGSNRLVSLLKLHQHAFQPAEQETHPDDFDSVDDVVEYLPHEHRPWIISWPEKNTKWYTDRPAERFCMATVTASTPEERDTLQQFIQQLPVSVQPLILEFPTLFEPPDAVPPAREICHEIRLLPNALPAHRPPFMLGEYKLKCLREQMTEVANIGWIQRSVSAWSAPPFLVAKKPHEPPRTVIDYRDLNTVTVNESVPLPRLEILLHHVRNAVIFSKLDLASGFHQIALSPPSQPLSAFCLPEPVAGSTL